MSFEITLHWQHFILIFGAIFGFWYPWKNYSGDDRYGIGALISGTGSILIWLVTLVIFFGLHYFGAF